MAIANEEEFRVYNSMTQQKEIFKTHEPGRVGMYVCGVTAYDLSHLGHARAAVNFDVLFRYLQHLGYQVTYVRNFTDVDDKIFRRANELGEEPLSLSNRFCEEYLVDMADLQCLTPTHQPRVSDHMEQIKDMITQIINNDCAYLVDGDVFFAVDKSPNYGQLSGQKLENHRAGERVAVDSRKRNPADFVLWKGAKPGELSWDSPWGPGRPGWHIECSAMSSHYLSFRFDIHGGGIDLIFPHHENEIAQTCAACQQSRVSYWMHNGHVTNNNEKMSKSLGNFFTIRETLQDSEDALSPFQKGSLKEVPEQKGKTARVTSAAQECISNLRSEFQTKMSDDLNTAQILTVAFQEALKFINSSLNMLKKKQPKQQQLSMIESLIAVEKEVKEVLNILGLLSSSTYSEVLEQLKDKALKRAGLVENDVLHLIEERTLARKNKDFSKSDQIRADLTVKGIALMDVGDETIWRPCVPVEQEHNALPVEQTASTTG
ncbi:cysteine--tRNA ligase 2, cytoplasmic-like isoform X2 [Juglans microcarpa x Juglans regia]|uniref:cysteine--tRNA ligase 2, cytoplasmic-like isoform X2 n=1 Tax=Juglans microcarpa x Juglans regia TaxID=2249226 RepID=UPI001B7E097E|nr:cysteine--tRNA ligase 2, cytoplasmic-like isoform X2 [Juglans microcarpa x Juglans regia]